jgi:hypothetical protein
MSSIKTKYKDFLNTTEGVIRYNEFKSILYSVPDSLIDHFNQLILTPEFIPQKKIISICDIGGGDGKRVIQILNYLHQRFDLKFQLDFIEQSYMFCKSFELINETIKPFTQIFTQNCLFENANFKNKYDFIFLIHSIFALKDAKTTNFLHSLLNENGRIIIFSNAQDSFLGILKKVLDQDYNDRRLEIDDIKQNLHLLEIDFEQISFDTEWEIDQIDFTIKIEIILDWLSMGRFKNFSQKRKNEVYNQIIELSIFNGGKFYFKEKEAVLVIPFTSKIENEINAKIICRDANA